MNDVHNYPLKNRRISITLIIAGFKSTGIFPVDKKQFSFDLFDPVDLEEYYLSQSQLPYQSQYKCKNPILTSEALNGKKKQTMARLKQETYGEVLTTSTVLDRLKKAQEEKIFKQVKVKTKKGKNKKRNLKAADKNCSKRPVATSKKTVKKNKQSDSCDNPSVEENTLGGKC